MGFAFRALIHGCVVDAYCRVHGAVDDNEGGRSASARNWAEAFRLKRFQNVDRAMLKPPRQALRRAAFNLVHHPRFEPLSCLVELTNGFAMATKFAYQGSDRDALHDRMHNGFTCVYLIELGVRVIGYGEHMLQRKARRGRRAETNQPAHSLNPAGPSPTQPEPAPRQNWGVALDGAFALAAALPLFGTAIPLDFNALRLLRLPSRVMALDPGSNRSGKARQRRLPPGPAPHAPALLARRAPTNGPLRTPSAPPSAPPNPPPRTAGADRDRVPLFHPRRGAGGARRLGGGALRHRGRAALRGPGGSPAERVLVQGLRRRRAHHGARGALPPPTPPG